MVSAASCMMSIEGSPVPFRGGGHMASGDPCLADPATAQLGLIEAQGQSVLRN